MNWPVTMAQQQKSTLTTALNLIHSKLATKDFVTLQNPKLAAKWKGPTRIIDIHDTNGKIKINNKIKVLNISKLKHVHQSDANGHKKETQQFEELNFDPTQKDQSQE